MPPADIITDKWVAILSPFLKLQVAQELCIVMSILGEIRLIFPVRLALIITLLAVACPTGAWTPICMPPRMVRSTAYWRDSYTNMSQSPNFETCRTSVDW